MDDLTNLFDQAVGLMVQKKYKEARKLFLEVTRRDPSIATAWHNLGIMEGILGKYPAAIAACQHAVEISPNWNEAWYVLGEAYAKSGNHPVAAEIFRKVVGTDPKLLDAWYSLGLALINHGDYKGAVDAYESALKANPDAVEIEEVMKTTSKTREDEIARLTKARSLFFAARNDIKKIHLTTVARELEQDLAKGEFRNDVDIRALNKEHLALIRERLQEMSEKKE
jgi:tetratricopeptide (TPR) repeat protein